MTLQELTKILEMMLEDMQCDIESDWIDSQDRMKAQFDALTLMTAKNLLKELDSKGGKVFKNNNAIDWYNNRING